MPIYVLDAILFFALGCFFAQNSFVFGIMPMYPFGTCETFVRKPESAISDDKPVDSVN